MSSVEISETVLVIDLDDGKANAVGHSLIDTVNEGLDQAESEASAMVIVGRPGMFSAGFDLKEFEKGAEASRTLVSRGANLFHRLFSHPQPVVAACTGHAVAAGAFLLLAVDTRIGAQGDFKIGLNETAIGMTLPVFALELANSRLSKRHITGAVVQSRMYDPDGAVDAGFLDSLAPAESVREAAIAEARRLGELPGPAYGANKRDIRKAALARISESL